MVINRTIIKHFEECYKTFPIVLITGARQVGKTTLVTLFVQDKKSNYISLDDKNILNQALNNPQKLLDSYSTPLIIDEVQKAPNLFDELNSRINEIRRLNIDANPTGLYILTCSQKFNLMKNVKESMAGKVAVIELPTLSQNEIRETTENPFWFDLEVLNERSKNLIINEDELYESIYRGFYPILWKDLSVKTTTFYESYVKTYIDLDVKELINLKDPKKFTDFLKILAGFNACEFVTETISNKVGVDNKTIDSWIMILLKSNIITFLEPFIDSSIIKRVVKRKKMFFNDTGLLCYLLEIYSVTDLKASKYRGLIVETYIINEIMKSYLNNGLPPPLYFYRDSNQNEIDLIIKKGSQINLIECKSGKVYEIKDVKAFRQLENTDLDVVGKMIICLTKEPYKIGGNTYVFPISCI